jgi:hypothetical protein
MNLEEGLAENFLRSNPKPSSLVNLSFGRNMSEGRKFGKRLLQPLQREFIQFPVQLFVQDEDIDPLQQIQISALHPNIARGVRQ